MRAYQRQTREYETAVTLKGAKNASQCCYEDELVHVG